MRKVNLIIIYALVGFAVVMIAAVSVVVARAEDPTPTWEPLYKTATPEPPRNLTCPTGTPVGWGIETPSLIWQSECAACQSALYPTATLPPNYTPMPTSGPTGTPAPTMTATPVGWNEARFWKFDPGNTINFPIEGLWMFQMDPFYANKQFTNGSAVDVRFWLADAYENASNYFKLYYHIKGSMSWTNNHCALNMGMAISSNSTTKMLNSYPGAAWFGNGNGGSGNFEFYGYLYTNTPPNSIPPDYILVQRFTPQGQCGLVNINWTLSEFQFSWDNLDTPPLPTPQPTPSSSYCYAVNGGQAVEEGIENTMPNITLGASSCLGMSTTIWNAIISFVDWIPGVDLTGVTMPTMELCFREISFGSGRFLGFEYDLDTLALIMAAIVGFRLFWRS